VPAGLDLFRLQTTLIMSVLGLLFGKLAPAVVATRRPCAARLAAPRALAVKDQFLAPASSISFSFL
jgi:hypothetical protein